MENNFFIITSNYHNLSTSKREEIAKKKLYQKVNKLFLDGSISGYIPLLTCLREEYYIYGNIDKVRDIFNLPHSNDFKVLKGVEGTLYFFNLVCGFDSIIKGEDQILSQIKSTYHKSLINKTTTPFLNVLFNRGVFLGKKFRALSKIGSDSLSIEGITFKIIKELSLNYTEKNILVLGTGELSRDILRVLIKEEFNKLWVTNRSICTKKEIEDLFKGVTFIPFDKKVDVARGSDIIISTTSAPHLILKYEELKGVLKDDAILIDLAVPRDIDERLEEKDRRLYTLDDIWKKYEENKGLREEKANNYKYLIDEEIAYMKNWILKRREFHGEV